MVIPGGAAPAAPALLRVRLLGGLAVDGVDVARLGSRKARTLVKRLALARGAPVSAAALVDALWPEAPPAHPADQVSVLASRARAVLGAGRLPRSDAGYALAVDWLDLDAATDLVAEARRRLAAGGAAPARAAAGAALSLLTGPLLADEPDADWLAPDRAAADRLAVAARVVAAEAALAAGAPADAAELARQALDRDPYEEGAIRVLVTAVAATGRPAAALVAYAAAAGRLRDELGVDPAPETEAAYLAVLRADVPTAEVPGGPAAGAPADLPGRAGALAALDAALGEAVRRTAAVVAVVEGEAGIGKTRLLDTWAAAAAARGVTVLRGAGDEITGRLPLQPVLDALARHLRTADSDPAGAAGAVGSVAALLGADRDLLGPLLGAAPPGASPVGVAYAVLTGRATGRTLLFAGLAGVLGRLAAATGPVALLLDDVHLADPVTAEWVGYVANRLDAAVLLVAARRPEEGLPYAGRVLRLDRLDLAAVAEVVGTERAAALHARSGGLPLFLVELDRWAGDGLPASVREAVADRVGRAGAAAPTLRAAAVLGDTVDLDLLAAVLADRPADLLDHLEDGVRRHLLVEQGAGFAFGHALVREALVAATTAGRRALLHREAARALSGRPDADPLAVAHHARLGGEDRLAAAALVAASALAARRFDFTVALRLADEAVGLHDGGEQRLQRARVLLALGRYPEAAADAEAARAAGAGSAALELAAWAAYLLRDWDEALRLADEGVRSATDPERRGAAGLVAGLTQLAVGRQADAGSRLLAAYEEVPAVLRPAARVFLARLRVSEGDPEAALALLADPDLPDGLAHPYASPHRHLTAAHAHGLAGRPAAALAELDRLDEAVARQQATRFIPRGLNYRAWLLRNLGAGAEADDLNERAFVAADRLLAGEPRAHAALDLADGRLRGADVEGACRWLDRYDDGGGTYGLHWRVEQRARSLRVRVALLTGDADTAVEGAEAAVAEAAGNRDRRHLVLAEVLLARARHATGDRVDVERLDAAVRELDRVAGLEAWWLAAQLAEQLGVPAWRRVAERRLAHLVGHAGPWALTLRAAAAGALD